MMILNLNTFPKKEKKETVQDMNTIVTDEECCICFSLEIDCNNLPDKICSNEKCRRRFHTSCLLQVCLNKYKIIFKLRYLNWR